MRIFSLRDEKFEEMQTSLDASIIHVAKKIATGEFGSGDVSLKLTIGTTSQYKDETMYEMPVFSYKINTNLQKKSNVNGGDIFPNMELSLDDETLVLKEVKSNQIGMFDEEDL